MDDAGYILVYRKKLLLREESLKMVTRNVSSSTPSSKTSSYNPPVCPPLVPSPPPPSTELQSLPSHLSRTYSSTETYSMGEKSTPSSSSHCHQSGFHRNASDRHGVANQPSFQGNPTDNYGNDRQSCYSASIEPELDDDWGFDLDDVLAEEESHYLEPPLGPPLNLKHPLSYGSETPQPCNYEPVGAFSVPKSATSHSAQSDTSSSYHSAHSNNSSYHSAQNTYHSAQSSKASSPSTSVQLSPLSTPYPVQTGKPPPSTPQTSQPSSSSARKSFRPPFLQQQGPADSQGLNTSFGRKFGKPSMFKPSGTNEPPKDDAAEFRGQYEHKREMYKIFNQVSRRVMDKSKQCFIREGLPPPQEKVM